MFAQVGGVNKKNLLSTVRDCMCVCVRACVRTFKVPVHACLWTGMFCLHCVRSCQVNTRLGPALLLLFARCAFQDVSRRRDHPAKETNTRSRSNTRSRTKGRPRQGAQTKASRWLARPSFRTTRRLHRNYSPRPPTNQPLESIGGELVWESGQWGGEIQRRGAAGSIQKTNWLHVCVFYFVCYFLCGGLQETSARSCRTATWACSSHRTRATAGDR